MPEYPSLPVSVGLQIVAADTISLHEHLEFAQGCEGLFQYHLRSRWDNLSYMPPTTSDLIRVASVMPVKGVETVRDLQLAIQRSRGIDVSDQRLVFGDHILSDTRELAMYGITGESDVMVVSNIAHRGLP
jgi:hypothetical protein